MPLITSVVAPGWIVPEYSSVCPFSAANAWLLLQHAGGAFGLYSGDGIFFGLLPLLHSYRLRWDRTASGTLHYLKGNAWMLYNVQERQTATVHVFDEYVSIDDRGKADISLDGNSRVLCGTLPNGAVEVFVYSVIDGKGPTFPVLPGLNSVYLTKSGYVVQGTATGSFLFAPDGTRMFGTLIVGQVPHMDAFEDSLVYCSSNDPVLNKNAVVLIDILKPEEKRVLMEFDWDYAMHISCWTEVRRAAVHVDVNVKIVDRDLNLFFLKPPIHLSKPRYRNIGHA